MTAATLSQLLDRGGAPALSRCAADCRPKRRQGHCLLRWLPLGHTSPHPRPKVLPQAGEISPDSFFRNLKVSSVMAPPHLRAPALFLLNGRRGRESKSYREQSERAVRRVSTLPIGKSRSRGWPPFETAGVRKPPLPTRHVTRPCDKAPDASRAHAVRNAPLSAPTTHRFAGKLRILRVSEQ